MIRILLAHPSRLVLDSLRNALDNEEEVYVVGCATTAEEVHFLLPHGNVVLLGTELKDATALELLDDLRMIQPEAKFLVFGLDEEPEVIISYIEAGASGYILQKESVQEMLQKVNAAYQEKAIVSPSIAAAIMRRLTRLANLDAPITFMEARKSQIDEITGREQEVLDLITNGYTNKEIAERLIIEYGTVKNHVHNILKKLDVKSRHDAATIFQMYRQSVITGTA
jgi:DNA-binding NarL/FixJ family response regulator